MHSRDRQSAAQLGMIADHLVRMHRRTDLPGGLSPARASALFSLVEHGPMRLGELATLERLSQPATTQLVRAMEVDGLVTRQRDPADARASLIAVTDAGRELSLARLAARASTVAALIDTLDADDVAAIAGALPALERLATAADAVHPPR